MRLFGLSLAFAISLAVGPAVAGEKDFHPGQVITDYGKIATVEGAKPIPASARFKVRFDTVNKAGQNSINKTFESAARFLNMHHEAGVALNKIDLAIVIHGSAVHDVKKEERFGKTSINTNAALIEKLRKNGVKFYVCGQSAAYHDVFEDDLLPGVELALSAMTAHALLDADGYSLNPF